MSADHQVTYGPYLPLPLILTLHLTGVNLKDYISRLKMEKKKVKSIYNDISTLNNSPTIYYASSDYWRLLSSVLTCYSCLPNLSCKTSSHERSNKIPGGCSEFHCEVIWQIKESQRMIRSNAASFLRYT